MMILVHKDNPSLTKVCPEGFSFTTLFFGVAVPLYRGDLKNAVIMLMFHLSTLLIIGWFISAFTYNKKYREMLMEKGYQLKQQV